MGNLKRVWMLGVCLVAVFALGGVMAGGASAQLPEFGSCEAAPNHEGKYADAGCTEPVKKVYGKYRGGYEWYAGEQAVQGQGLKGYNFEHGAIGPTTFETTSGRTIQCSEGELFQLQLEGPKNVGKILTFFYGCEFEGQECRGELNGYGEISDEEEWGDGEGLKGELVYVAGRKTSTPTVGLTLTAFNPGERLFTVACDGSLGTVEIGGAGGKRTEKDKGNAAISVITPVDEMTTEFTQTFTQTDGVQEPGATEKGKHLSLLGFLSNENKWFGLGVASTFQDISESERPPVEIKAVP